MNTKGHPISNSMLKILLLTLALAFSTNPAWSQEPATEAETEAKPAETEPEDVLDKRPVNLETLVVTGSRLQRETYMSIAPLQIITAQGSREAGLIDAADILQQSTAAGGTQIDLSFSSFVLDNGPGASTVDLRGLGAARTLVLMNGRRLAPSGVEGAPASPDLNLVPSGMVQRYEILLDGASSIYGSDAVAGVTNIIMRDDYDGFEGNIFANQPDQKNGDSFTANLAWGQTFDRGVIGVGLEYVKQDAVRLMDRRWTAGCDRHREIDENGEIRTMEQFYNNPNGGYGMAWDDCRLGTLAARVSVPFAGSIYYTPGYSNGGWVDFSESSTFGFGVDGDGDGQTDLSFRDYDLNGKPAIQESTLWPESDRLSIMAYGDYTFEGEMNNSVYFEANYNDRNFNSNFGQAALFPFVPGSNPFNICNPDGIRGVDCGLAQDALLTNPNYVAQFGNNFESLCADFGIPLADCTPATFDLLSGPIGPAGVTPIVAVVGDRNLNSTSGDQVRVVVGLKGDLPAVSWGSMSNWVYDVYLSYTDTGIKSQRPGIRGDRLDYSLETSRFDDNGNIICGNNDGCVPIDLFATSLYPVGIVQGDFATQAERDYLFDIRDFNTKYKQTIVNGFIDGVLFAMPDGSAIGGIGLEWREDDIQSIPDDVARDGLFFGFFSDGGATGKKWTKEAFAEIELPLLAGRKGAEQLLVNLSGRYTDDEFYGSDVTYAVKLGWRPVSSLLLRGTYGTSFRAPNVREVFLRDQTGFGNIFDPCFIPEEALDPISGGYNPALDTRDPVVLENCARNGVDPTMANNGGFNVFSTEISRGGQPGIEAETSDSFTYGFAWEQPWSDTFRLTVGATYYEIDIDQTIIEPSAQFLVNGCYTDPQFDSAFCSLIERGSDDIISIISAKFINRDNQTARGIDLNVNYDKDFNIGSHSANIGIDLVMNRNLEASITFLSDDGVPDRDNDQGELGYPDWKGNLGLRLNVDDFRLTWIVNYIGDTQYDPDFVDEFSDAFNLSDTCLGPPDDVLCRDYADTPSYVTNSMSLYWYGENMTVGGGVRNVFNKAPPLVDGTEWVTINGVPLGSGYDLMGRTYFLNFTWRQ